MAQQAQVFKTFVNSDATTTRTLLHESIPITGSMLSGTYAIDSTTFREVNIKAHSHGMFQSVYDYPYLSSSANHIFDITVGASGDAPAAPDYTHTTRFESTSSIKNAIVNQQDKKLNVYSQMAQVLVGYGDSGSIRNFDVDGNFNTGEDKILAPTFINFSRLLTKDEVKKGSFQIDLGVGPLANPFKDVIRISDFEATGSYRTNSPAGEYGILYASDVDAGSIFTSSATWGEASSSVKIESPAPVGLIYYQAGVAVLNSAALLYASGSPGVADPNSGSVALDAEAPSGILNADVCQTASVTFHFDDKPNEESTITLTDAHGASVTFEVDDTGDGGAVAGSYPVDGSGATGFATALYNAVNAQTSASLTATNPADGKVVIYQDYGGNAGNSQIIYSEDTSWGVAMTGAASGAADAPTYFSGGLDYVPFVYAPGSTHNTGAFDLGLVSASIDQLADSWRRRIQNIQFNNTTELNSAVYFCRAHHNEFNYSSNPTYLTGSKIRVKNDDALVAPHSYITTVGLYSADNELLAVAKVSEPIKKSPENEVTLRVRLDY